MRPRRAASAARGKPSDLVPVSESAADFSIHGPTGGGEVGSGMRWEEVKWCGFSMVCLTDLPKYTSRKVMAAKAKPVAGATIYKRALFAFPACSRPSLLPRMAIATREAWPRKTTGQAGGGEPQRR